mmetsp:Transcript_6537/g.14191  ORF Transcript_6537/g.14191 Transcript_6537/m.14191 type:complete len:628 (+) Transcript_6537:211-2094(+)|eukprot:CAMPEP_0171332570 /NCGR_PEP_ID=MMETSP0878-20121228/3442_1 /TAXON_ID=67004 /ORGANISM="Thalassiosira weissflogii, Strain CCMP1336" /LENGTH=627 /DNA_ID=CAMNT_0011833333 /DNA_START=213 /DNA_END=2096 /DNA_ORIENTATION=-
MSSSRYSLRKRQPNSVLKDDYKDVDLDKLLEEHERSGEESRAQRVAKKQKTQREEEEKELKQIFSGYDIPLDTLPALCIERIYNMLDSPQDLYNLAFTSKFLMSLVTPEVVIRSAVFNNLGKREAKYRKIIGSINQYLANRSIHIPSPHRLLRLLVAKSCERGDSCWGKNLATGVPASIDPSSSTRPFGLAICEKCVKFGSTNVNYSHFSRFQHGVAFYQWNRIMGPITDAVKGEVHGPLIPAIQLMQIEGSYRTTAERKAALEEHLSRAHTDCGDVCKNCYESKAAAYVEIFQSAEDEADEFIKLANEKKLQIGRQRREERLRKKRERIQGIYEYLEELLEDCPYKDVALACEWRENDQDCLKFKCSFVQCAMCHIIGAPATAPDRAISDAATQIRNAFKLLSDKQFFTFTFLSESEQKMFRQGMYKYCTNESSILKIMTSNYADDAFFVQVRNNQPKNALIRALHMIKGALPRCFALAVVDPVSNSNGVEIRVDDFRRLAEVVWKKRAGTPSWTLASIENNYIRCNEEFQIMKRNAIDYLNDPVTVDYLRLDVRGNRIAGQFHRRDALNEVFNPSTRDSFFMTLHERCIPYNLLRNRQFTTLRAVHDAYYRRPEMYGLRAPPRAD